MKQYTIRLDDEMEAELKEVQDMLNTKSAQKAIVHCLRSFRVLCDIEAAAEDKINSLHAIIDYLEQQKERR